MSRTTPPTPVTDLAPTYGEELEDLGAAHERRLTLADLTAVAGGHKPFLKPTDPPEPD